MKAEKENLIDQIESTLEQLEKNAQALHLIDEDSSMEYWKDSLENMQLSLLAKLEHINDRILNQYQLLKSKKSQRKRLYEICKQSSYTFSLKAILTQEPLPTLRKSRKVVSIQAKRK